MAEASFEQILVRVARLESASAVFSGVAYRSSTPRYATQPDLLTAEGSRRHGGRWNPIGIAAVYASLAPETAMAETLAHHRYYEIPIEDAMPRTFVAIQFNLHFVLDLRNGRVRQRLQLSESLLLTLDWRKEVKAGREPVTQLLGRAVFTSRLEGAIVPSAADPAGANLVIFPENLDPTSTIALIRPEELRHE